jgi:hypothetical protein
MSLIMVGLLAGAPAIGFADSGSQVRGKAHANKWKRWHHEKGLPATAVPELDPNAAGQSLALLLAATALLIERRRIARA